jgi:hypothetical protein
VKIEGDPDADGDRHAIIVERGARRASSFAP